MDGVMIWATITAVMTAGFLIIGYCVAMENIDNIQGWRDALRAWWRR